MKAWFSYLRNGVRRKMSTGVHSAPSRQTRENIKILYPFIRPHIRLIIVGIALILLLSLLAYPKPLINRFLIDDVIMGKKYNFFIYVVLALLCLKIMEKAGGIIKGFYFVRFENTVILDIQKNLIKRVLGLPKSFFDKKDVGYLMSAVHADVQGLRWFFSGHMVFVINSVFQLLFGICLLFYLQPLIAFLSIIVLPGSLVFVRMFSRKGRILSHYCMEHGAILSKNLQEVFSSIPLIKAFANEKKESDRLTKRISEYNDVMLEQNALGIFLDLGTNFFSELASIIVLVIGVPMIFKGRWTLGSMFAFWTYLGMVYGAISSVGSVHLSMQGALAALDRVSNFYSLLPEENRNGIEVGHLRGQLEFKNVLFSYDGSNPVLEDITFKVDSGEHLVIVGPSGVGKTTLISLIMGFYRPSKGEVLFDSVPLSHYSMASLRKRIGYVSQRIYLTSGSILENLKYGNDDATKGDIIRSAKAAGIHDFIESLPDGYNSMLGENSVNLSSGQAQRISIARALVRDPDILILDEPTSSLDILLEKSIFNALPEVARNKTVITVTHRPYAIKKSGRIVVLNNNRIEAQGFHEDLIKNSEYYSSMAASCDLQR